MRRARFAWKPRFINPHRFLGAYIDRDLYGWTLEVGLWTTGFSVSWGAI